VKVVTTASSAPRFALAIDKVMPNWNEPVDAATMAHPAAAAEICNLRKRRLRGANSSVFNTNSNRKGFGRR
jgi:hypothetical protein